MALVSVVTEYLHIAFLIFEGHSQVHCFPDINVYLFFFILILCAKVQPFGQKAAAHKEVYTCQTQNADYLQRLGTAILRSQLS